MRHFLTVKKYEFAVNKYINKLFLKNTRVTYNIKIVFISRLNIIDVISVGPPERLTTYRTTRAQQRSAYYQNHNITYPMYIQDRETDIEDNMIEQKLTLTLYILNYHFTQQVATTKSCYILKIFFCRIYKACVVQKVQVMYVDRLVQLDRYNAFALNKCKQGSVQE